MWKTLFKENPPRPSARKQLKGINDYPQGNQMLQYSSPLLVRSIPLGLFKQRANLAQFLRVTDENFPYSNSNQANKVQKLKISKLHYVFNYSPLKQTNAGPYFESLVTTFSSTLTTLQIQVEFQNQDIYCQERDKAFSLLLNRRILKRLFHLETFHLTIERWACGMCADDWLLKICLQRICFHTKVRSLFIDGKYPSRTPFPLPSLKRLVTELIDFLTDILNCRYFIFLGDVTFRATSMFSDERFTTFKVISDLDMMLQEIDKQFSDMNGQGISTSNKIVFKLIFRFKRCFESEEIRQKVWIEIPKLKFEKMNLELEAADSSKKTHIYKVTWVIKIPEKKVSETELSCGNTISRKQESSYDRIKSVALF